MQLVLFNRVIVESYTIHSGTSLLWTPLGQIKVS